jgi:tRNA threonylcarbamoyladenosine biosynthesis protein TsaB
LILSFDTSEKVATVALVDRGRVVGASNSAEWLSRQTDPQAVGQSTAVVSLIKSVLEVSDVCPEQVAAIAMSNGPGSFTGLRVGVVVARMLCYAWSKPLVAVDSLEVSAAKLSQRRGLAAGDTIWAAVNGQRRQLFGAKYEVGETADGQGGLVVVEAQRLHHHEDWLAQLESKDHVTGAGTIVLKEQVESRIAAEIPELELACCDAIGVAGLAESRLESGSFDDLWKVAPVYFRPSAAEEVRHSKMRH